jgi:hypothetical protein
MTSARPVLLLEHILRVMADEPRLTSGTRHVVMLVFSVLTACGRADVAGVYDVTGELTVEPRGAPSSRAAILGETVEVRSTGRHYQFGSYEVTIRGCALRGEGKLSPAGVSTPRCKLDGPAGPVTALHAFAEISPASGGGVDIHLRGVLDSDGGIGGTFDYKVRGSPKRR